MRLRIVQSILIPYCLYYLPLLDWKVCHIKKLNSLFQKFLWNKKGNHSIVLVSWECIAQPKLWGGLGVLHIQSHMEARRANLLKKMLDTSTLWSLCLWQLIHAGTVHFHGLWDLDDWNKLFSHAPLKVFGNTASMLISSWKLCCGKLI